ncbi:hypothetical protein OGAPHI_002168 [Ogataea philodendri]|uniref:Uncharacterized protein n=1 Tax=Ogataea philodendri TaxID=1378263 RepID=A0A9P8PBW5_9ASCO|nr:uncharacterized protein OGAPHI_002168 [Ogataea philodendri]KAH3668414.1 hypothetical protein OGAPHI_002168 [Ogataea philodendri]
MFSSTISSLVSLAPATSYSRTFMISSIDSFPSWSASASPSLCPPLAVPISFSLNLSPYLLTLDEYLFSLLMRSTFGCSTWGFSGVDPRVDARNRTTTTAAAIKYLVDL